jgi:hypothetical protein
MLFYLPFILTKYILSCFNSKSYRRFLTWNHINMNAIDLLYAWVLRWLLNNCPIYIKLGGIIKPVDLYAQFAKEMIPKYVIKHSVCTNILTWFNNIFPIGNQEYLPFIIYTLITQFITPQLFNWMFYRFRYIWTRIERIQDSLLVSST